MKIDWKNIWKDFDTWFDKNENTEWEIQRKKIQVLVNKEINSTGKFNRSLMSRDDGQPD